MLPDRPWKYGASKLKTSIIPIFIPHLGCPHLCTFCNQKKISSTSKIPDREEIIKLAEDYKRVSPDKDFDLAFYGGSFTAIKEEEQEYYLQTAAYLKEKKMIKKIRFSTRPDAINHEVLQRAARYKVDIIELGLQSMQDTILHQAERGHRAEDSIRAVALIREYDFSLGLQIMPGLKGDNRQTIEDTFLKVIDLKPDFVRIYPTLVIRGTKLAEEYLEGSYQPFDLEEMVDIVAWACTSFNEAGIKVIRMGLQDSDNLHPDKDLLAGPWHPAFGEMVFARIYQKELSKIIEGKKPTSGSEIIIRINPQEESKVRGQKNKNIKFLEEKYQIKLSLVKDQSLEKGKIETEV